MKKTMKKIGITLLGLTPLFAFAQPIVPTVTTVTTYSGIINLINTMASWLLGILLAFAVVMGLIGAFNYFRAAGDEEKLKTAKNYLLYAAIGIIVGLVAKGAILLIQSFLGTNVQP